MTATASVSPTGDPYLDGILSGTKWGVTSLTFSFPTDPSFYSYTTEAATNFKAFTTVQQEAVREVLQNYSAVANLTFTEVTETSTQHARTSLRRVGFAEHCLGLLPDHGKPGRRCLVQQLQALLRQPGGRELRLPDDAA